MKRLAQGHKAVTRDRLAPRGMIPELIQEAGAPVLVQDSVGLSTPWNEKGGRVLDYTSQETPEFGSGMRPLVVGPPSSTQVVLQTSTPVFFAFLFSFLNGRQPNKYC